MNASVSALSREDEVQSKIRKVRAFGRNASVVCEVLFWLTVPAIIVVPFFVVFVRTGADVGAGTLPTDAPASDVGDAGLFGVLQALLTPLALIVSVFLIMAVIMSVWLAVLHQLSRLFHNLSAGEIYTPENVRRVRNVGLSLLVLAVLRIVIPTAIVVARSFIDASLSIDLDGIYPTFSELFSAFATAGLVLLASWIMDVGLYVKDHADALQRDAELTI